MTYGIRYTPDGWDRSVIIDGSRVISSLGSAEISMDGSRNTSGSFTAKLKGIFSGGMSLIIPRRLISIFGSVGDGNTPGLSYVTGMSFSGNTLTANYETNYPAATSQLKPGYVDVFSLSGSQSQTGSYGIRIVNGSNFMEINDTSYLGFVTWKGTVDVNGIWNIPQDIVNMGNYVVFANWNNANTPLYFNRANNRLETYTGFSNANGSVIGGSVTGIKVVIVSCGFIPDLPASGYGFVIRNAQGQRTFTSKYAAAKWNGAAFSMPAIKTYSSSSGEVTQWVGVSGEVSSPMAPLCTIGYQTGDYGRSVGSGRSVRPVMYAGFKMSNNQLTGARGAPVGSGAETPLSPSALQVACSLPCLDAADYF